MLPNFLVTDVRGRKFCLENSPVKLVVEKKKRHKVKKNSVMMSLIPKATYSLDTL